MAGDVRHAIETPWNSLRLRPTYYENDAPNLGTRRAEGSVALSLLNAALFAERSGRRAMASSARRSISRFGRR
jgi:hypothetical protein